MVPRTTQLNSLKTFADHWLKKMHGKESKGHSCRPCIYKVDLRCRTHIEPGQIGKAEPPTTCRYVRSHRTYTSHHLCRCSMMSLTISRLLSSLHNRRCFKVKSPKSLPLFRPASFPVSPTVHVRTAARLASPSCATTTLLPSLPPPPASPATFQHKLRCTLAAPSLALSFTSSAYAFTCDSCSRLAIRSICTHLDLVSSAGHGKETRLLQVQAWRWWTYMPKQSENTSRS